MLHTNKCDWDSTALNCAKSAYISSFKPARHV